MSHLRSFLHSFHVRKHYTKKGSYVSIVVVSICTLAGATLVATVGQFGENDSIQTVHASEGYHYYNVSEGTTVSTILQLDKKSEITPDNEKNQLLNFGTVQEQQEKEMEIVKVDLVTIKQKQEAIQTAMETQMAVMRNQARANEEMQREITKQKEKAAKEKAAKEKAAKEKAAKEKAAKEKAAKAKISLSSSEQKVLEKIVEAEAGDQDIKGRMLVANVVMNRVKNKQFPNDVKGVVYEHSGSCYQFSTVMSGYIDKVKVSKTTKEAVKRVIKGEDYSKGALYFVQREIACKSSLSWFDRDLTRLFKHGCHTFYK